MGPRGRDREQGRGLSLGWDEAGHSATAPGTADGGTGAPQPSPSRLSPRARRILAITASALLVVALTVGLPRLLTTSSAPERAVTDFLQAVVQGDAEQVREAVEDAPDASPAALTPEILGAATGGLESFEIAEVEIHGEAATVTALLHGGTSSRSVAFTLSARSDSAFAPIAWELDPVPLPEFVIDVPFGVEKMTLNGVSLPLEELEPASPGRSPQLALQLLPGGYELSILRSSRWTQTATLSLEAPVTFGAWRKPVRDLQIEFSEDGEQEVRDQIDADLADCLRSTSPTPQGCPFEAPGVSAEGEWALLKEPEFEIVHSSPDGLLWQVWGGAAAHFAPQGGPGVDVPFDVVGIAYIDPSGELRYRSDGSGDAASFSYALCMDAETGTVTGILMLSDEDEIEESSGSCA